MKREARSCRTFVFLPDFFVAPRIRIVTQHIANNKGSMDKKRITRGATYRIVRLFFSQEIKRCTQLFNHITGQQTFVRLLV